MALPRPLALLALACCLLLLACSPGGDDEDDGTDDRSACTRAVPRAPAVELRYRVESSPTRPGSFEETRSALCSRVDKLRLTTVQVGQDGPEIVVRAPRRLAEDAELTATAGELRFYDWEPNVVGKRGPDLPFSGRTSLFQAVQKASEMSPRAEPADIAEGASEAGSPSEADRLNDGSGARFYLFAADGRLIAGPAANRGTLRGRGGSKPPAGSRVLKVPRGIVVVEAERSLRRVGPERRFVLEDDVELGRSAIADPRAEEDSQTGEPVVVFDFTDAGRRPFASLTKRVAQRASSGRQDDPDAPLARFAIALDERVVALAAVDPRESPEGLDGRTGAQIGGFSSIAQARRVARLLEAPALPGTLVPVG